MKAVFPAIRRLWKFFAISLGVHLVLLLGVDPERQTAPGRASSVPLQLQASVYGHQRDIPLTSKSVSPPKQSVQRNHFNSAPRAVLQVVPADSPVPGPSQWEGRRQALPPGMGGDSGDNNAAPTAAPPLGEGVSPDALRHYVLALVPEARRLKRYPALARERGWEGTVEVTVRLNRLQGMPAIAVTRSSGFPILDEQAMAIIGQAVRLVVVPELLRGKEVSIPLPIRFSLED